MGTPSYIVGREQTKLENLFGASDFVLAPTTEHKEFNKQTNLLGGKGNVRARTFFKWHISKEQARYDIQPVLVYNPPHYVSHDIWSEVKERDIYVSVLFHVNSSSRLRSDIRIAHGFVLSDMEDYLISYYITGPTWKSTSVVLDCLPYIVLLDSRQEINWELRRETFQKQMGVQQ